MYKYLVSLYCYFVVVWTVIKCTGHPCRCVPHNLQTMYVYTCVGMYVSSTSVLQYSTAYMVWYLDKHSELLFSITYMVQLEVFLGITQSYSSVLCIFPCISYICKLCEEEVKAETITSTFHIAYSSHA